MLVTIDNVLTAGELSAVRDLLERSVWDGGDTTAGSGKTGGGEEEPREDGDNAAEPAPE